MEVIAALPFILLPFFFPVIAGLMAVNFGRKFWVWFIIGAMLPFVANIILLCLPEKRKSNQTPNTKNDPVNNEDIFNHLVSKPANTKKDHENEVYFSASA